MLDVEIITNLSMKKKTNPTRFHYQNHNLDMRLNQCYCTNNQSNHTTRIY